MIPKEQFNTRLRAIMPDMIKKGVASGHSELKELFTLHNDIYKPITKMSCCSCRARVFRVMVKYYNDING